MEEELSIVGTASSHVSGEVHNFDNFDVSKLKDIPFFEGKFYMVSKEFSIFISEQEKFDMPGIEDYMIGYLIEDFK